MQSVQFQNFRTSAKSPCTGRSAWTFFTYFFDLTLLDKMLYNSTFNFQRGPLQYSDDNLKPMASHPSYLPF